MRHEALQWAEVRRVRAQLEAGDDPLPRHVEIHPTDRCNHRCAFCFHGGAGHPAAPGALLTVAQYRQLFTELAALGIFDLSISGGGEPTLSPDLPDLFDAALEAGLRVRLVTHGTHVDARVAQRLPRLHEVRVSLDAGTAATWAALRQVPEAWFERALDTLRLAAGRGPHTGATFLVNAANQHEVMTFVERVGALPVDALVFKVDVDPARRLEEAAFERAVAPVRAVRDARIDVRAWVDPSPRGRPCRVSHFKVAFDPSGTLHSCCLASQPQATDGVPFGALDERGFAALWERTRPIRASLARGTRCGTCNITDHHLNRALEQP
jgi:MoaA/NifB/PqqE/SkfB family radical SAM enzyme